MICNHSAEWREVREKEKEGEEEERKREEDSRREKILPYRV